MSKLICQSPKFDAGFPEKYPWAMLDQITISSLGEYFSVEIERDLKTTDRLKVPGLRHALNLIANSYPEK